jgi:crotonobetainyl-CoA:carnitine CoA-transferase CaiB-like acyl-CoA transferase
MIPGHEVAQAGRPRPKTGQHTRAVLAEAGFAAAEIEALIAAGAAGAA